MVDDQPPHAPDADLQLLEVFAAVVSAGSISAASRQLGTPKSTVSRSIARLETSLGVNLFERSGARVVPSRAGEELFRLVGPQLTALRQSLTAVDRDGDLVGEVRFGAPPDFAAAPLPDILVRFALQNPRIRVELASTNGADLAGLGLDLALRVRIQDPDDDGIHGTRVGRLGLGAYASGEYLSRRGAPRAPADLRDHDWVADRSPLELRLLGETGPVKVKVTPRLVAEDARFRGAAIAHGGGIGVLPHAVAHAAELRPVLPEWHLPDQQVWLLWPSRAQSVARVLRLRDFVRDEIRLRLADVEPTATRLS